MAHTASCRVALASAECDEVGDVGADAASTSSAGRPKTQSQQAAISKASAGCVAEPLLCSRRAMLAAVRPCTDDEDCAGRLGHLIWLSY